MELSDDVIYSRKYQHLNEYCNHVSRLSRQKFCNDVIRTPNDGKHYNRRLQHRIYHVKKEINHLKRLKRTLCERLMRHKSVLVDFNLEIPDEDSGDHTISFLSSSVGPSLNDDRILQTLMTDPNDSGVAESAPPFSAIASSSTSIDRVIGEVVTSVASAYSFASSTAASQLPTSSAPPKQRRRRAPNTDFSDYRRRERPLPASKLSLDSATERNIIAIIDSVVNETHDDALRDGTQQSAAARPVDEERMTND